MQKLDETRIEAILIEAGLVDVEKLQKVKEIQKITGEKIEKLLLSEEIINYKELLNLLAINMGVDYIDLETAAVNKNAIYKVSSEIAKKFFVFPFDIKNNHLYLAMENPEDIFLIDEIKVFIQMEIKPFLADCRLIEKALSNFYSEQENTDQIDSSTDTVKAGRDANVKEDISEDINENIKGDIKEDIAEDVDKSGSDTFEDLNITNAEEIKNSIKAVPEKRIGYLEEKPLRYLIKKSQELNAADIHIDISNEKYKIRYRAHGKLIVENGIEQIKIREIILNLKKQAGIEIKKEDLSQKGTIKWKIDEDSDLYINVLTIPTVSGEKILIKLESKKTVYTYENLGFSDFEKSEIELMLQKKSGLIIISGEKASGKTTTGYELLRKISSNELNIMSIEKKVKCKLEDINQVSAENKNDEEISELVRNIVEFDPDVIFVDADVNEDSLEVLLNESKNGKLVIIIKAYPDAYSAFPQLLSGRFERSVIANSLTGIIAQKIVKKKCPECHTQKAAAEDLATGCINCGGSGYIGKHAVFEVLRVNEALQEQILNKPDSILIKASIYNNHSNFKKNILRLINEKIVTNEEISSLGMEGDLYEGGVII